MTAMDIAIANCTDTAAILVCEAKGPGEGFGAGLSITGLKPTASNDLLSDKIRRHHGHEATLEGLMHSPLHQRLITEGNLDLLWEIANR